MKTTIVKIGFLLAVVMLVITNALFPVFATPTDVVYFDLAIDEPRQKLYGSDKMGGTINVISMVTHEVVSTLNLGSQPAGLDIDPNGNELAVALMGQGEIAFVDLNTLAVIKRVVPEVTFGPNEPYDVIYGRPGRLYSVGNPGSSGLDNLHVFDTITKTEVGHS
jgi:DNA-binding beta-propeller fold protein YncE